ncbi:uncharacterized protein LOC134190099 isoform X2 [Corticium candelabrum]|uniref:uncharacterized protein LOC134190099 isoform X2 n=1 Tax=Corticium candelabrum TaxID=121492 RepID=UPI002E25ACA9|nr:uncharacterized protein LOC134190099 isoform X2 [Corticium candelabrum]
MSGLVIKQGYLVKSPSDPRSSVKSWRKRWVVLYESHLLKYFKDETTFVRNGSQKGDINLNDCIEIDHNVQIRRAREYMFLIKTNARNYYFIAESASEMKSWVDAVARLSGLTPSSQQAAGRVSSAHTLGTVTATDQLPDTNSRPPTKRRSLTEPNDSSGYFLVGQVQPVQEQTNLDVSQPVSVPSAKPDFLYPHAGQSYDRVPTPVAGQYYDRVPTPGAGQSYDRVPTPGAGQSYDRVPTPVAPWQTAPGRDYKTLDSTSLQSQSGWSRDTLTATNTHDSSYNVVSHPHVVQEHTSASTLPKVNRLGVLNDRSRYAKRYDHPPGSSATEIYSVPPFAGNELYMTPRKNPTMTPPGVIPPHIDRNNKPGGSPPGPDIDRSLKPGTRERQRKIQYAQIDLVQSPTLATGPQQGKTQYCQIDLMATMRHRHASDDGGQRFQYQHESHLDEFVDDERGHHTDPYIDMHDMIPPDVGGVEEYIPMKNGVHGDYYTYMRNQDLDPNELYLAVGNDGSYFPEDPYGVMVPTGQNGMPSNHINPQSIRTYYEV